MSEDTTQRFDGRSFEERVFDEFRSLNTRMASLEEKADGLEGKVDRLEVKVDRLEEKVDRRLMETRPIWEGVQIELRRINSKLDQVIVELFESRTEQRAFDKRLMQIEEAR